MTMMTNPTATKTKKKNPISATKTAGRGAASSIPTLTTGNLIVIPTERLDTDVSLYVHIPFCTRKCHYCHFYVLPDKALFKDQLMEGLALEWEQTKPLFRDKNLVSLYFGGGTPFLLGPEKISALIQTFSPPSNAEITLEANPENITPESMKAFAAAGINRVSIGIQTLDPVLLGKLGRLHSPDTATRAVLNTFDAGISNISVDLMYDLPGQSLESWVHTLQEATRLPIKHLSLYNLTIEPHTVFFKYRHELEKELPGQETSLQMLLAAEEIIEQAGLQRYEISAFAQPGYHSKHNTGYWTGRSFIGMGPSAFSYWNGERFRNIAHLGRYLEKLRPGESAVDFSEQLDAEASVRELIAIRLRLIQGIPETDPLLISPLRTILDKLTLDHSPMLEKCSGSYRLTKKGRLFYDELASEII
jgi:oxygen-independent coproporphyrinogen-3 oxidase